MSRSLDDLDERFRPHAVSFLDECKRQDLDVLVVCTLRTMAEQKRAYAQGRTTPGRIVTRAVPGSSAHNYGMALDGCPLVHGKLVWTLPLGDEVSDPIWQQYGTIARQCGLEWAGDWAVMREAPHVQMPNWKALVSPELIQ